MNTLVAQKIKEQYLGMRYKIDKNGDILLYANAWTLIVDCCKWCKHKLT